MKDNNQFVEKVELVIKNSGILFWKKKYYEVVRAHNTTDVDVGDELDKSDLETLKSKNIAYTIYQDIYRQRGWR